MSKIIETRPSSLLSKQSQTPYFIQYGGYRLIIHFDVFPPELSCTSFTIFDILGRYKSKCSLDMGCGTGILSLKLSEISEHVVAIDNHLAAIENCKENIILNKRNNVQIINSDLFSGLKKEVFFDLIVFNQPYYPSYNNVTFGMGSEGGEKMIYRFFSNVMNFIKRNTQIIMPFSTFAGANNDPSTIAKDFGFHSRIIWKSYDHLGDHYIYNFEL